MDNRLVDATWTYHNGTKHSDQSVRTSAHFLDWLNQPLLFKVYSTPLLSKLGMRAGEPPGVG